MQVNKYLKAILISMDGVNSIISCIFCKSPKKLVLIISSVSTFTLKNLNEDHSSS